jgi:transketolase
MESAGARAGAFRISPIRIDRKTLHPRRAEEASMERKFAPRRAVWIDLGEQSAEPVLGPQEAADLERLDLLYRSLCAMLYNYVPTSGHPGGSISSGRIVASLLFGVMDYDVCDPDRDDADLLSYAAGHKALGLYAMWALRDEVLRAAAPAVLPADERRRLRLEDLLGFRRNPTQATALTRKLRVKALDGHPTPATPFVRLSTGASGVGVAASLGLALGAADWFGPAAAPRVHVVEGEGGLTPGRVAEALAFAGTASLGNAIVHLDWNQASIDSDRVTREDGLPGDYVQWTPMELFHLHDWNVVYVPDGTDLQQVAAAQRTALEIGNGQPTAIVYRTTKGWRYGIEGRASHGAGHRLCSAGYAAALAPLLEAEGVALRLCEPGACRCAEGRDRDTLESCFLDALMILRGAINRDPAWAERMAARLLESRARLDARERRPRHGAPALDRALTLARHPQLAAEALATPPGTVTTLRGQLGRALDHLNRASGGALFVAAADLLGSTSVADGARGFAAGWFNARGNPASRTLAVGGICEDAIAGVLSGVSTFRRHVGVGSSYAAFIAPLGHIAARLHAIGAQARAAVSGDPYPPMLLVCAHAGLKTGEDGPTHADPQPLQVLQENFPPGTMVTLTPWEPAEVWPLLAAALAHEPAVIAPFVTRPAETVPDRAALGLAPAERAVQGVYLLRAAEGEGDGTVVLQESGVAYAFVEDALPLLRAAGIDLNVYYVASAELFDALPAAERERIFPAARAQEAMGITGFTLATMYRWVCSELGRAHTLHPYMHGRFPGSGPGEAVIAEAGLDGASQFRAIRRYVHALAAARAVDLVGTV